MTLATTSLRNIDHLDHLIRGIHVAMMTTVCKDGALCSRPMAIQGTRIDGGLWFFTKADSAKVGDIEGESHVNLTFENSSESIYVSISGRATLVQDRQLIDELWHEELRLWFPEGVDDPLLALLRVDVDNWAYWNAQSGVMSEHTGTLRDAPAEVIPNGDVFQRTDISGAWASQDVGTSKTRNNLPFTNPAPETP